MQHVIRLKDYFDFKTSLMSFSDLLYLLNRGNYDLGSSCIE